MERLLAGEQAGGITLASFPPGERFIRQGETSRYVYVIRDGITKCYIREDNGKDYIFEFLGKGEITGELEVIRKTVCLCNIETITAVTAYAIPTGEFALLMRADAELNGLLLEELATRIQQTCVRASYQQLYPVEYGLLRLLKLQSEAKVRFSKKNMADYLAITVRSFNRTIRQLREKNVVSMEGLHLDMSPQELEELLRRWE
ncbi:Crp/Fnr family transcriptional regulator [Chitinophaga japonensis]|uniref:CRP-like cAMP-binding protein n=1 Tax=Chitinophaga japonensis TaxID=104662 RepID=A0A562SZP3_CHIJA|nr:Crp/Fnr family transcriptional regulator [Chitinophaga japonensis]TWI86765.1 CRP-like cAMP-binding protein [Chitinophaga japonensis]